jgi:hypothetical protein
MTGSPQFLLFPGGCFQHFTDFQNSYTVVGCHSSRVPLFILNLVFQFLNPSIYSFRLKMCFCTPDTEFFTSMMVGGFRICALPFDFLCLAIAGGLQFVFFFQFSYMAMERGFLLFLLLWIFLQLFSLTTSSSSFTFSRPQS